MIFLPLCVLAVAGMRLARPKAGPAEVCAVAHEAERPADSVRLFRFDPNTIDYAGLQLGLTAYEAASLLKYRAAGKVFRIPEDVATCYGFTDSLYFRLAPYIRIGRKYAVAPPAYRSGTGGASAARPRAVPHRHGVGALPAGHRGAVEAPGRGPRALARPARNPRHGGAARMLCRVGLGGCGARTLCPFRRAARPGRRARGAQPGGLRGAVLRVYGIGAKSAQAIPCYRERLGGFRCVEQLAEVRGGHGAQLRVDCENKFGATVVKFKN